MSKLKGFLAVCAAISVGFSAAAAKYGAELKVNGYTGASTLENFPVLVKLAEYDAMSGTGLQGFDYDDLAQPETGADAFRSAAVSPPRRSMR